MFGGLKCGLAVIAIAYIGFHFWPSTVNIVYDRDLQLLAILEPYLGLFLFTGTFFEQHRLGQGLEKANWPKPKVTVRSRSSTGDPGNKEDHGFHVEWPETADLEVRFSEVPVPGGEKLTCYDVAWLFQLPYHRPSDCFSLGRGQWYGGAEVLEQHWPMNEQRSRMQPYLTGDYLSTHWRSQPEYGRYGSLAEPYWISSSGLAVHVDDGVTLHASFNADGDGLLCLKSDRRGYVNAENNDDFKDWLNYTVCRGDSVVQVHRYMADRYFARPRGLPDERTIRSPIWSTWARYKVNVNQTYVLEYAKEIKKYGFPNSQIEIDDKYTTKYGDFNFDTEKFPSLAAMMDELRALGFRVTSWITPFANIDSEAFVEGAEKSYWMKTRAPHSVPSLTKWWQGTSAGAGVLDVTNPEAVDWYVGRLKRFQTDCHIDSFKFDAGELDFLPRDISIPPSIINTNQLTDLYVRLTEKFGGMVEVRSGYRSQDLPIFFRMLDIDSTWGYTNGLRSIIPKALFMGIIGYPFILPDMIGGNGYGEDEPFQKTSLPGKELFVRWLELSAFLPSMQFSIAPWQYDDQVVKIAGKFVELHERFVAPEIIKEGKKALLTGDPIIRPLWWIDQSEDSLTCDDQFLIGSSILVAPVVDKGSVSRDVFLPGKQFQWKDHSTQEVHRGGQWLRAVDAPLDHVPLFVRIPTE